MGLRNLLASATTGGPFRRRDYTSRGKYAANYQVLAQALVEVCDFETHLDVGCGQGLLITPLAERHGKDVHGIEGSPAAREFMAPSVKDRIRTANVMELTVDRQYDLVSCVEVLEHVPETFADRAVAFLAGSATRHIYLSAAIPRQPGVGHINCQPSLYWIRKLAARGWSLDLQRSGALLDRIAGMTPCWWLPQNALIFSPART